MNNYFKKPGFIFFLSILFFVSCKKDNGNSSNLSRNIKYEITGNFSGKLTIVYSDNVTGNTVLDNVSLPWTKEITYPGNVVGIGIGAQASTTGSAGQTATMKIYSAGNMVKMSSSTAGSLGELTLPAIAFTF